MRVNVEVLVILLMTSDPDVAFVPDHAPDAVQLVADVALHASVALPPDVTLLGLEDNITVGAGVPEMGRGTIAQTGVPV